MNRSVVLRGYKFSVYNRIAQVSLHEKGVAYEIEEIDPFAEVVPERYKQRHPFCRVPVLSHGTFDVYETAAICRYIDAAFDGPRLIPLNFESLTRLAQTVSIIDSYGYRPMVRQVFAHRVFRPAVREGSSEDEVENGLAASRTVLQALETLAAEAHVLDRQTFTLADCHLAPMIAYFVQAPEGKAALSNYSALSDWWEWASPRASVRETDPGLPKNHNA
ncbi:glutathione S-transferase family protein [Aliiroseovarius sp. F20344]|uniref:glutathione S-transferase family protein n=1 Tax=Aliiroseovarius sp. F20344 TaxID=2926414 RepID=UPI001FF5B9DD|nr:glutathione S-transferase family protein [Aliiroseovarius sp. F20344]MCK0142257.1 glutathione S-transferase family protein [Aliiroseovarius sp. F20344]